ncbi:Superoxide dismutase [Fe] [Candidatus Profftia lariciata]|uniref:Fe-Mn family superoxide dismutase n=1 Tax=Candidatus Profftia lariciata TaxID=1987921 RepID=UPI001D027F57|nr:Fe-Mn family superoxide dismutase [Candidatus Profftia lariciata]UDG81516.1 Superoxide dismutase [Fe] [Candidatus Profftia lariciata]
MSFTLPTLPYKNNALEPYISEEAINYHYGKHHSTYVMNLNNLIQGTDFVDKTLEYIIKNSTGSIFNNAAQVWNHTFYWNSLSPNGSNYPTDNIVKEINKSFGSFEIFKKTFIQSAINNFGSGWTWLIKKEDHKLAIVNTSNADTIINNYDKPLFTVDIWEHAYYIDYRNMRSKYLENFWSLINWDFVTKNIA